MLARRDAAGVRLLTRNGIDWAGRYPGIMAAVNGLRCRSCLLDGEVVICGEDGIPIFNRLVKGEALLLYSLIRRPPSTCPIRVPDR